MSSPVEEALEIMIQGKPRRGRPRPHSVSGTFPALDRIVRLLPLLEGVDRRVLVDLPRAMSVGHEPGSDTWELAEAIRSGTEGRTDPRDVVGDWDVIGRYGLAVADADFRLHLSRRGHELLRDPEGRITRWIAGREGLRYLLEAIEAGSRTLAELLPGWRRVLEGNPRFAASTAPPRSLGQRVGALVIGGWLEAHGDHAERLEDPNGFRRREAEPAFAELGGGVTLSSRGRACLHG